MIQWVFLALREWLGSRWITAIVFFAVTIAFLSVASLTLIGRNADRYINDRFAAAIPPNVIKVSPAPAPQALFGFALTRPEGTVLDDATLKTIRSFEGIRDIYPLMASQIPLQAVLSIFGLRYRTDLICIGAPYAFISNEIPDPAYRKLWRTWRPGNDLPSLLPILILDAYNDSMALPNGLPKITESFALNQKFQISFGKSSIKATEGFVVENATVCGFTKKIASICIVVPLPVMKFYNEKFGGSSVSSNYMTVFIETKDHASYLKAVEKLKKMKLTVETEKTLSQEILQLKNNAALLLRAIGFIIVLLSVMAISFCTVIATLERIEYYRLLRVLGASKIFITVIILIKYAFFGWLAGLAGAWIAHLLSAPLAHAVQVPGFAVKTAMDPNDLSIMNALSVILPVLSTIPALIKLNFKSMSED
jgi:ABC-type antimicrobial peptide transport system permease subunit